MTGSLPKRRTYSPITLGLRVKVGRPQEPKKRKGIQNQEDTLVSGHISATQYRSPIVASTLPDVVPRSMALLAFPF